MRKNAKVFLVKTGVATKACVSAVVLILSLAYVTSLQAETINQKQKIMEASKIETVTVTAQKQDEDLQDVPISLSVFDSSDLEDLQVDSISDIAPFVPNFMVFDNGLSGQTPPTVRGLSTDIDSNNSTMGLYVDGIPVLTGIGFNEILLDVQRVEVLKGPQGTLYGKNAEAGVINVITRSPGNEVMAGVGVEIGEDSKQQYHFSTSGPIIKDKLFIGISGLHYEKDGFIHNSFLDKNSNDRKHNYGKIHIRSTPSENFSISAIVSYLKYDDGGSNMGLSSSVKDREVSSDFQGYNHASSAMGALKMDYAFSNFKFESITTTRTFRFDAGGDWDFSPVVGSHSNNDSVYKKLSQEFRISSATDRFSWLAGIYGDGDRNNFNTRISSGSSTRDVDRDFDGESVGAFIHTTWALTGRLSLISGLRYDLEEKSFVDDNLAIDLDEEFSEFSPKLCLQYRINPAVMFYTSVAKGYQSGGFNSLAPEGSPLSYDEETLWSYEVGSKTSFFDGRLIFSAAVYYMNIDDMQVNTAVDSVQSYRANAARATSKGAEMEIRCKVTQSLSLFASYGYNDTAFDSFSDDDGDYKGNTNPYAPKYNYNIGAQYRHQDGYYARVDLNGYGKMYFDKANQFSRDAYELVNAKIGYEAEHFDLYLYAKNLFDKEYDSDGYYSGYYTIYSPPREIGINLVWRL